jgi:hypothetical protein
MASLTSRLVVALVVLCSSCAVGGRANFPGHGVLTLHDVDAGELGQTVAQLDTIVVELGFEKRPFGEVRAGVPEKLQALYGSRTNSLLDVEFWYGTENHQFIVELADYRERRNVHHREPLDLNDDSAEIYLKLLEAVRKTFPTKTVTKGWAKAPRH